ncbi:hypothetical protein BOTBODRAFT_173362 [Botryobasidium botryosum FD-172 SS1]|uniref:Cytochrome P450 n=1 Tax=Botryobasidium botryosum (strain FD-172 SS1) TaxID=930990 RepID=A0A067MW18_BOTB1|nr:hypothetical protein BOTBODRAFT_173362 [Botryobasidium botryosum FD-172 SS1]
MIELPRNLAVFSGILSIFLAVLYFRRSTKSHGLPLPPGPKPEFLIGNARHLPTQSPWLQYTTWREKYGDIFHLEALGNHVIILNSYEAMHDLLDLRQIYADRQPLQMVDILMGWGRVTSSSRHGETWRKYRRLMRPAFQKDKIAAHSRNLEKPMRACLLELLRSPEGFYEHLRLLTGRAIIMFTYGLKVDTSKDPLVEVPERGFTRAIHMALPGQAPLVDTFHFLRYIPSWFPGAGFKRNAKIWRKELDDMVGDPFKRVKAEMAAGVAVPSFTSTCLEDPAHSENDIVWSAGSMYVAGADTTHALLSSFILAMATHPDVQKRAQAEIDTVVKGNGLPTLEDRENLPYIECLLKELQRWLPAVPLSLPHRLMEDDYYGGYFFPKGSIVFPNVWALSQDEAHYKDPKRFWPERFENPETAELDPYKYAFGWGRRVCAGMNFADATLYLAVVSILSVFDISKPLDEHGNEVEPEVTFGTGVVSRPQGFKCTIRPRSNDAAQLIKAAVEEMAW